ncbi:hypothetical protein VD0002_g930 [Verticillium dahliae]|uniref:Uncharacterized protein n=1 Tax=Verticillium dahliae TaxID=27337 RepID=A0AA45AP98_VERDA|nr:hypothetical protein BJF96_g3103 [Verticillium dahliae]PNH54774.1 hypothetical protein VD0003_g2794 [Verticillium dahliae]PNH69412.1 hypothetical protein VD0002_g930 [Verticillium dahliae]
MPQSQVSAIAGSFALPDCSSVTSTGSFDLLLGSSGKGVTFL